MKKMSDFRLSRALCTVVGDALVGSHATLNELFKSSGAPGDPPDLSHATKWKVWLFRVGQDSEVDSLSVLGNILEEFMDLTPDPDDFETHDRWINHKKKIEEELEKNGLQYFPGGRIIPTGMTDQLDPEREEESKSDTHIAPQSIDKLLLTTIGGLQRAMHPLSQRRKGLQTLKFDNEYDIQDLLHALLRPWVADIRPEEFTPSYAGSSNRMDFLLPAHKIVLETKIVRDSSHSKSLGQELIIDISHYKKHPDCKFLWCVVYDPQRLIQNIGGLEKDLSGEHSDSNGSVTVKLIIV